MYLINNQCVWKSSRCEISTPGIKVIYKQIYVMHYSYDMSEDSNTTLSKTE